MNPLSKLILESADSNMLVDVGTLWNNIWKLGYSRQMIEDQVRMLGLNGPKKYQTLIGLPFSSQYTSITR